jgi:sec-independent protein translocase protein TatC
MIDANKYLTLIMLMFAAFGVAFEFPLLLVFLMLVGVLSTEQLRRSRRWTAVGISVFAAVITPSADPFSMLFMAVPMYIFYELAILIGRAMKR